MVLVEVGVVVVVEEEVGVLSLVLEVVEVLVLKEVELVAVVAQGRRIFADCRALTQPAYRTQYSGPHTREREREREGEGEGEGAGERERERERWGGRRMSQTRTQGCLRAKKKQGLC